MRRATDEQIEEDDNLWRYFKTDRFIDFVSTGELYFAAASQFADPFEGATAVLPPHINLDPRYPPGAELGEQAFGALRRLTKINCWHRAPYESHAMWQLYGAHSKGVAVRSTPARISAAASTFRLEPNHAGETLWGGNVRYVDLLTERLRVGSIARFWHKHMAFSWEREFRIGISLEHAEEFGVPVPNEGIRVQFNLTELIEQIVIGPLLQDDERQAIQDAVDAAGFTNRIKVSSMLGTPRYT